MVSKRYFDSFNEESLSIKLGYTYYDEIMSGRHALNSTFSILYSVSLFVLIYSSSTPTPPIKAEITSQRNLKELGRARIMGW